MGLSLALPLIAAGCWSSPRAESRVGSGPKIQLTEFAVDPTDTPANGQTAPFVDKAVAWLIAAQHADGGWGAGSHRDQQLRDPHKVQTDPASTAFCGLSNM